ncbi:hypothetical protein JCM5353_008551, partial [Sporobolomyces roseus]
MKEDPTKRLGQLVKVLRIGSEFETLEHDLEGYNFELEELLNHFMNLEVLFVGRIRNALSFALFQSPRLRQLHVWDSTFVRTYCPPRDLFDKTPSSGLESLQHLTLEDSMLYHYPLERDIPKDFPFHRTPNLTALNGHHSIPKNLSFLISWAPKWQINYRINTRLLFFSTDSNHLTPMFGENEQPLSYLPSSLRFLRITSGHFFGSDYLTPYFLSHPSAFPQLEELILPMRLRAASSFETLREWAKEKRVRTEWEKDEESPGTVWDRGFWEVVERVER